MGSDGESMKKRWLFIGLAGSFLLMLLLIGSVLCAVGLMGGERHYGVGSGVGLVEIKGIIIDSQETVKQLNELRKDDHVKAVVVRIDSPGGVVGPSQEIHAEIKKLAAKKKVIVSMGSVAASGGYYIAVAANSIFANPGTITGSIGVLMRFSNLEGLMGKIGMKSFTLKTGKFKDVGSPAHPMSEAERAMLQAVIDNTHSQFVKAVAEGRRLPEADIRNIADGRIFTGEQALALKLVDRIGTLQDAVEEAGRLGGISGEPHLIRPPKKKRLLLDMLVEETASRISGAVRQENEFSLNYELEGIFR
jgi:protease-4